MTGTPDDNKNLLSRIQSYRKVVLIYEGLNKAIHKLLADNDGGTEKMSTEDRERYRQLARQRDELNSEMRFLEQQLLDEAALQDEEPLQTEEDES